MSGILLHVFLFLFERAVYLTITESKKIRGDKSDTQTNIAKYVWK